MDRVLVIGATGNIGRQVVSQLATTGAHVRALTRKADATGLPPQIEVMRGDLTLPDTLDGCLNGIDTVFLVWTAPASAVVSAMDRIARHARRIMFLSAPIKTPHPLFQQPNPQRVMVEQIEQLIETSGVEWTPCGQQCSPQTPWAGGLLRFAPAMSCVGHTPMSRQPQSTKETSPPSRSAPCARKDTQERNMF